MYLAAEPTGPFFMLFVFSVAAATLRWGWPGTLWTGSAAVLLFIAMGAYAAGGHDTPVELNAIIIRGMYLAVVAALLGYLGDYERRLRGEMVRLAAWPTTVPREGAALIGETLDAILRSMVQTAEGVNTTRAIVKHAREVGGLEMPLAEGMHRILFENSPPLDVLAQLMSRKATREHALA